LFPFDFLPPPKNVLRVSFFPTEPPARSSGTVMSVTAMRNASAAVPKTVP
jgi:hypothetical protein